MSRLTVTEKEHWKSRIEHRIDKAIERLETTDPALMQTLRTRAEAAVYQALGVTEERANLNRLREQLEVLKNKVDDAEFALYSKGLGGNRAKTDSYLDREFRVFFKKRVKAIEDDLLLESQLGQQIAKLRAEKEALLDTVWLATSSIQIRPLDAGFGCAW